MILGQHTVAETRDLIRTTEFRVNQIIKLFGQVSARRQPPKSSVQNQLDVDLAAFVRRWTDVRDQQTILMTASMVANPNVLPIILPAEVNFVAIDKAVSRDTPRLVDIQQRLDSEAALAGLPPVDLSATPAQDSPDADFVTLHALDAAIAKAEAAKAAAANAVPSVPKVNFTLPSVPWWVWGIGIAGVGAVGYSVVRTGKGVYEKAERDKKYIYEHMTPKFLPGYKG